MKVFCPEGFQDDEILGIVGYLEDQDGNEVGSLEVKFQKIALNTNGELYSVDTDSYDSDDQDCIDSIRQDLFEPFELEPEDELISQMIDKANTFELHF